jgi:YebC/PmpR family DNA-binding regulatory protein
MGRIFEVRKSTMFARWDRMAKQFSRIGKEIAIAVKAGGPDPDTNPALRRCAQNAKAVNMPKDRVEAAIKRAMGKEMENYEEILYEGYGPHGVPILVETATDNHVRTVANVKSHFNKGGGTLGNSGSVSFQFKKMGVLTLKPEGLNMEDLELELIDFGLEEMGEGTAENGDDAGTSVGFAVRQNAESARRQGDPPAKCRSGMDSLYYRRISRRAGG